MNSIPQPKGETGWQALKAILREKNVLASLEAIHEGLGNVFQLPLPGFNAVMLVGPEANRFLLVEAKDHLRWRADHDPVTKLLRHGVLVEDGEAHDELRHQLNPSLHRKMLDGYVETMWRCTDQVCAEWTEHSRIDMLVEMRKIALLILTETLFKEDFTPQLKPLWQAVLRSIQYISPGLWLVWRDVPRPGYRRALQQMDEYLYQLIAIRREQLGKPPGQSTGQFIDEPTDEPIDMLSGLIASGMSDALIRDQLLTMLIAGHDTSTALLAWALHLLTTHSDVQAQIHEEIDGVLGSQAPTLQAINQLPLLERTIKETLRLYPPIHLGSRVAATDVEFKEYLFPAGTRILYSIYLTHRDKTYWPDPHRFDPERFTPEKIRQQQPYTYMPFGGGSRNCIGTAFAQVEAKVVLARIFQKFELRSTGRPVRPHMGATLEPHPGVMVEVRRR